MTWLLVLNDELVLSKPFSLKPSNIFSTEGADSNDFHLTLPESSTPVLVLARMELIFAAAREEHGQHPDIILHYLRSHMNLFSKGRGSRERHPLFRWQSSSRLSPYDKWRWQWIRPPVDHNISITSHQMTESTKSSLRLQRGQYSLWVNWWSRCLTVTKTWGELSAQDELDI